MIRVKRDYWTFKELAERWRVPIDSHDIRRAVLNGVLRPCMIVRGDLARASLCGGAVVPAVHAGEQVLTEEVRGWYYPQLPVQTEPFDAAYVVVSKTAIPADGDVVWILPKEVTLSSLLAEAVVMEADLAEAEAVLSHSDDLDTKQTNSLLKLVSIMSSDGYGWRNTPRSNVVPEIVGAGRSMGIDIADGTALRFLRMAWSTFTPNPIGLEPSPNDGGHVRESVQTKH